MKLFSLQLSFHCDGTRHFAFKRDLLILCDDDDDVDDDNDNDNNKRGITNRAEKGSGFDDNDNEMTSTSLIFRSLNVSDEVTIVHV